MNYWEDGCVQSSKVIREMAIADETMSRWGIIWHIDIRKPLSDTLAHLCFSSCFLFAFLSFMISDLPHYLLLLPSFYPEVHINVFSWPGNHGHKKKYSLYNVSLLFTVFLTSVYSFSYCFDMRYFSRWVFEKSLFTSMR